MNHESHHLKVERKRERSSTEENGRRGSLSLSLSYHWQHDIIIQVEKFVAGTATVMRIAFELRTHCLIANIHGTYPFHLFY